MGILQYHSERYLTDPNLYYSNYFDDVDDALMKRVSSSESEVWRFTIKLYERVDSKSDPMKDATNNTNMTCHCRTRTQTSKLGLGRQRCDNITT